MNVMMTSIHEGVVVSIALCVTTLQLVVVTLMHTVYLVISGSTSTDHEMLSVRFNKCLLKRMEHYLEDHKSIL